VSVIRWSDRFSACFLVMSTAAIPAGAAAQGVFEATPSISASQQYDSNLFSTGTNQEADFFTRVSPAIESSYATPLWRMAGQYVLDIERFANHPALTSMDARQQGSVDLRYHSTPRIIWSGNVEFWKTQTPGELNEATGLTLTRATARRVLGHASVLRHASPLTSQILDYTQTRDQLAGRTAATTHDAVARVEHHYSARDTVRVDYRFREFLFGPTGGEVVSTARSQVLLLGATYMMSPRTTLSLDGGPRLSDGSVRADVLASLNYRGASNTLSLAYTRTQTTVIGLAGVAETQSVTSTLSWPVWSSIRVRITPGVFQSVIGGSRVNAGMLSLALTRPVARDLAVDVDFDANAQRGALDFRPSTSIARHVVAIRLIAGSSTSSR